LLLDTISANASISLLTNRHRFLILVNHRFDDGQ